MNLTDCVKEITKRCGGLNDQEKARALIDDLKACGLRDGPALQDAFDAWRTVWDKRYAPTAPEFAKHYEQPIAKTKDPVQLAPGERTLTLEQAKECLGRENQAFSAAMREQMGVDKYDGMVMECMRRFMAGEPVSGILRGM